MPDLVFCPMTAHPTDDHPTDGHVDDQADTVEAPLPKAKLSETLWSVWAWFAFGVCVLVWVPMVFVVYLVTLPFDRTHYWSGYLYRKMPVAHQKLNPLWHFHVTGDLPSNPRNPYVVVANHESFVDILLISHLPWEMKWLSKKEMFKIPVAGWLMHLAGDIKLYRGDKGSALKAMVTVPVVPGQARVGHDLPRGHPPKDGELGPFKDGAFRLAIESQVPILPLAVTAPEALRKHDWRFGRCRRRGARAWSRSTPQA